MTTVVSGFLAVFGLPPIIANPPEIPPDTPVLWAVLAWVRREFQQTLFNQTPTATPVQTSQTYTGIITGSIGASDPEGDPVTYSVTGQPAHGVVVVGSDGTFTYVPGATLAATGGTDTFTVTVSEANASAHLHGLPGLVSGVVRLMTLGLISLDDGSSVEVPVTVLVPAARRPAGVVDTITVGDDPGAIATDPADPTGRYIYVARGIPGGYFVDLVDLETNSVVKTYPVGEAPRAMVVYGATVYVTNYNETTVSVIDTLSHTVSTIEIGDFNPRSLAISPDGRHIYLLAGSSIYTIDVATNQVVGDRIETGGNSSRELALSPDGTEIYVANAGGGMTGAGSSISVIDTTTGLEAFIHMGTSRPENVAFSTDGTRVYVARGDSTVAVIDTATRTVVKTVAIGGDPGALAVSPDGKSVYVVDSHNGRVLILDTATNLVVQSITVPVGSYYLTLSDDGRYAFVSTGVEDTVTVIDTIRDI
jgi:YVTN family beta-propeller protein